MNVQLAGAPSQYVQASHTAPISKQKAKEIGLPTLPGSEGNVENISQAVKVCKKIGFPVLIKATNGGGGRGIKKVTSMDELKQKFVLTKSEALQSFGDDSVYIEKYESLNKQSYIVGISVIDVSTGKNYLHSIISKIEDTNHWSDEIGRYIHFYNPCEILFHTKDMELTKE